MSDSQGFGPSLDVMECGVDWLTVTAPTGGEETRLLDAAEDLLRHQELEGEPLRKWNAQGYVGIAGVGIERGLRSDGAIVRLHSDQARTHWQRFFRPEWRLTRIDLQVTAVDNDGERNYADEAYDRAVAHATAHGRAPSVSSTRFAGGGCMTTIGRRSSERYLRVYEKALQEPERWPDHTWRWEVEYKQIAGTNAALTIQGRATEDSVLAGMVYSEFERHGVAPPFLQMRLWW